MHTKMHKLAPLMVYFYQGRFKEPIHVVYNASVRKGWLLEHFYGLRFWPIFDITRNDSRIHPLTIKILFYTFLSIIRLDFIIILPFYGVFVTFQNFEFRELFRPYWKGDEPYFTFDDTKWSSMTPSKIYKVIWHCWCQNTCP